MSPRLFLLFSCAFLRSVLALPITVTETTDFPATGGPNFVVGAGVNTLSGSVAGCQGQSGCASSDFTDNFSITVPAGFVIASGSLSISSFASGIGASLASGTFLPVIGATSADSVLSVTPFTGTQEFTATSPHSFTLNAGFQLVFPGSMNYTLTLTVDAEEAPPIPEPASAFFLPIGLAALACIRRCTA